MPDPQFENALTLLFRRSGIIGPYVDVNAFNRSAIEGNFGIPCVNIVIQLAKVSIVDCVFRDASHPMWFVVITSGENTNRDFITCRNLR